MSIIVIVRSVLDILLAVADILSTWTNERGLNTSTCDSTHIFTQLGEMCCWQPPQIKPHQDSYEAVAALFTVQFFNAEDMSFPTIRTNSNGPLSRSQHHIAGATIQLDGDYIIWWQPPATKKKGLAGRSLTRRCAPF